MGHFATAQQDLYQWRVGVHGGYFFYLGDLNSSVNNFYEISQPINDPDGFQNTRDLVSYGLSVEHRMSAGWSLKLLGTQGVFQANDRTINYWNGNILSNTNYNRSLNVETSIWDVSLMATYHFDDGNFLKSDIEGLIKNYYGRTYQNWSLQLDYHFGGYAKVKPELLEFIKGFEERNQIQIEQIYTGKMLFGIYDLIQKGFFKKGEKIVVIHTGGLQGRNIKER